MSKPATESMLSKINRLIGVDKSYIVLQPYLKENL